MFLIAKWLAHEINEGDDSVASVITQALICSPTKEHGQLGMI